LCMYRAISEEAYDCQATKVLPPTAFLDVRVVSNNEHKDA
jgi:hypothetical protein